MTLKSLHIRNLILVDQAAITFESGLNVISGETGSGKSAILEAISLLLGNRSDTQLIRQGAESASVEALIELPDSHPVFALLSEKGIASEEEGCLLLKRELSANGKSRAFINHQPAQISLLKEIGPLLIEIVAQHASQKLYGTEQHAILLDLFGDITPLADTFAAHYDAYHHHLRTLQDLKAKQPQKNRECAACLHEIEEIEEAHLKEGEEESLFEEYNHLASADQRMQLAQQIEQSLGGDRGVFGILKTIKAPFTQLSQLESSLQPELELYQTIAVEVEELVHTMRNYSAKVHADPARFHKVNERLNVLNRLKKKYGSTQAEIEAYLKSRKETLASFETLDETIAALEEESKMHYAALVKEAEALQKKRAKAAKVLQKALSQEFTELNMPHARLEVSFTEQPLHKTGAFRIEFLLSANLGEPFLPIKDSASGGELSRVLLAIQLLLADKEDLGTLVFDEIDANIGGTTAAMIGEKLKKLGQSIQVFCVTHFPQVAKCADHHLFIAKEQHKGRTFTTIAPLTVEGKSVELRRMSGDLTNIAHSV